MSGYDPKKAALFNKLIQSGLSEDAALAQAGITDPGSYVVDEVGTPDTNRNYGQLTDAGFNVPGRTGNTLSDSERESDPDVDRRFRTTVTNVQTTNNDTVTVTGGGSRTTVVTPTQFQDTAASRAAQANADRVAAEKTALSAQLKAEGKSGAEVLRDPRYRELSQQQQSLQNQADDAKTPVPGTGTVTITTANIDGDVTDVQASSPGFETANAGIEDPGVQTSEVGAVNATPGSTVTETATDNTDPGPGYGEEDDPEDIDERQGITEPVEGISPYGEEDDPLDLSEDQEEGIDPYTAVTGSGDPVDGELNGQDVVGVDQFGNLTAVSQEELESQRQQALLEQARTQATLAAQRKQANDGDWRVRLRLGPAADYLYRDPEISQTGILYPLAITDGVVFPYTPQITTSYQATYNSYDLTHSNYRGYFYQGSHVGEINITATFTAQDTSEANYLLAVIHFFRSVTKMFYGKDAQRGSPPPLVFLQGLGEFQFNLHPCVVSQFNYNLPADVDYIRARSVSIANNTQDLLFRRDRQSLPTNVFSGALERLRNAGLKKGAINTTPPAPPTFGTNRPTYVPTKLDITLMLLPVQTRTQVSQQFSLKQFANGDLKEGGFW